MNKLKLNLENVYDYISEAEIFSFQEEINKHHKSLLEKTGKGNDYLGWLELASEIGINQINEIKEDAERIKSIAEVFVVIGIGGSYLGSRAIIEALKHQFSNFLDKREFPEILYAGQNISEDYLADLIDILDKKEYAIAVISKSGTTTEPALAFRIIKDHLENKYGKDESRKRIIAITDKQRGALKKLADEEKYSCYVVPDNVGGRYSVLTPVGLLPLAVAGFNIEDLISGFISAQQEFLSTSIISKN
ncbi:MAG: glucose-6-phosphate isomerase, partial [Bacteroidales bacterium]|nr:glucose-6-phosphate isomerase [Bacteroidales bacterium]